MAGQDLPFRRKDLIDTRKRQRSSSPPQAPPSKMTRFPNNGDAELRSMVFGHRIPASIFDRLERRFMELKSEVTEARRHAHANAEDASKAVDRGYEIQRRCTQIHDLKQELGQKEKLIAKLHQRHGKDGDELKELKTLQKENAEYQEFIDMQTKLIEAGTKALQEQRLKNINLHADVDGLRSKVAGQETTIGNLNDIIAQMQMAEGDTLTGLALEAQAQRTLSMVQGLQSEVAEKDGIIRGYQTEAAQRGLEAKRHEAQLLEKDKMVSESKHEQANQGKVIAKLQKELEMARQKQAHTQEVVQDAERLIKRLIGGEQ